jgi:hypothetical protein
MESYDPLWYTNAECKKAAGIPPREESLPYVGPVRKVYDM